MPPAAQGVFGARLPLAERYADFLADQGTVRGLIGPREVPRLWERHILNCAVLSEAIEADQRVADVGSGAGLPGIVLAIVRPDLAITLIEPLLRRATFLQEGVDLLDLANVRVVRGRAEEFPEPATFDVVTSRAVAELGKLAAWSMPLVRPGGLFLPMKGASAEDEVKSSNRALRRLGAVSADVLKVGAGVVDPQVTLVAVRKAEISG
ncbi:MAG: 16S rRNA (guanine(527)-N(7))-methyltransferase RsmG [Marmoricola sp.]